MRDRIPLIDFIDDLVIIKVPASGAQHTRDRISLMGHPDTDIKR